MLNDKTLKSALAAGALLPVYIIVGDDSYLKKQALERIIAASVGFEDDINLIKYNYGVSLQTIYDELNGFPLMADKKCVILSDFELDSAPKSEFEKLCELASEPYDTSIFVITFETVEIDVKKSTRFKKLVSCVEKSGGDTVKAEHKTPDELSRWLVASAKKQNCTLSVQNALYIVENCSSDINVLTNELTKLCAFVKQGEITRNIIERVCVKSIEASVYDLSAKIISGDSSGAMKLLDELYYMNFEPTIIFYCISSVFVDMYRAYAAKAAGKNPDALASEFGMGNRGFLMRKATVNLRKYDEKKLNLSFDAVLRAERELKSNVSSSRGVLEKLIVRLIYIMKTGEAID